MGSSCSSGNSVTNTTSGREQEKTNNSKPSSVSRKLPSKMLPDITDPRLLNKTIRIFLSSTFTDTTVDRNHMIEEVFEPCRQFCRQHGIVFEVVDLRWGVRQESVADHRTVKICLAEIKRCQAYSLGTAFIAILGDKYGWRPLPPSIRQDELEKLMEHVTDLDAVELIRKWYLLDQNEIPSQYILQPINSEFNVNASSKQEIDSAWQDWGKVEKKIWSALSQAADACGIEEKENLKYWASITHHEVQAGIINDQLANTRAIMIDRRINDIDVDHEAARLYINLKDGNKCQESEQHLAKLKEESGGILGEERILLHHNLKWQKEGISVSSHGNYIKEMCQKVKDLLMESIKEILKKIGPTDSLEEEITRHALFCREHSQTFVGRENILKKIEDYTNESEVGKPLIIFGESGVGKTSLVSKIIVEAQKKPKFTVIYRFCGTSSNSSTGRLLVLSLCKQLCRIYDQDESQLDDDYTSLVEKFPELLSMATKERPAFVVIDSLDQLSDENGARKFLEWLPRSIPANVHLIVSTLPDIGGCLDRLRSFGLPDSHFIELDRLDVEDGPVILDAWLSQSERRLTGQQRQLLLDHFNKCPLPLYFQLIFQECLSWTSYRSLEECKLETDVSGMIRKFFELLEKYHGKTLVSRVLGLIAITPEGINPDEFLDILSCDDELLNDVLVWHTPPKRRLPPLTFSRLRHDLGPFVVQRGSHGSMLIAFFHRQFWQVAQERYCSGKNRALLYSKIASFFSGELHDRFEERGIASQPLAFSTNVYNLRKLSQLPISLLSAGNFSKLKDCLCDLKFIQAKCSAGMAYELLYDATTAAEAVRKLPPTDQNSVTDFEEMLQFLRRELQVLRKDPLLTYQQAQNFPVGTAPERAANALKATFATGSTDTDDYISRPENGWVERLNKPTELEPFRQELSGHTRPVLSVCFSNDGTWIYSASEDRTVRVWNRHSSDIEAQLEGHTEAVTCVRYSPVENLVVTTSGDRSIRLWDGVTGQLRNVLENAHSEWANCVSFDPEGKRIVSASFDKTLKIWDVRTGSEVGTLVGHSGHVIHCSWSPVNANELVSCGDNLEIFLWNVTERSIKLKLSGHEIKDNKNFPVSDRLSGHATLDYKSAIWCAKISPDGTLVASTAVDNKVLIWDHESGELVASFELPNDGQSVAFSSDGKRLVASSSAHMSVHLFDVERKQTLGLLGGHSGWVMEVDFSPDDRLIASVSQDKSVRVWDSTAAGKREEQGKAHTERCWSVAMSSDGKWVASASDDFKVCIWDVSTTKPVMTYEGHEKKRTFSCGVRACTFSRDSNLVASGGDELAIRIWRRETGEDVKVLRCAPFLPWCLRFSKDDKRLVAVGENKDAVVVYDLDSESVLRELTGFDRFCQYTEFSPGGNFILGSSIDNTARIYDAETFELSWALKQPSWVTCATFSHDGTMVATCSLDQNVRIWDTKTKDLAFTMPSEDARQSEIRIVSFSPDDTLLASGGLDQTVRIWNMKDKRVANIFYTASGVWALAWHPTNKKLLVAGDAVGQVYFLRIQDI